MDPPDDEHDHDFEEPALLDELEDSEEAYQLIEYFAQREHNPMIEYYTLSDSDVDDDGGFFFDMDDFLSIGALFPPVKRRWRKFLWEAKYAAINDADIIFVADASAEKRLRLEEGLWRTLPEELVHMILARLPWAARCRLRDQASRLEEGLWTALPEELVHMILFRLPWAAQCRFRCVCLQWKLSLSSRALNLTEIPRKYRSWCTVRSEGSKAGKTVAFCHDENKWFDVCYSVLPTSANAWDLMPKKAKSRAESVLEIDSPGDVPDLLLVDWVLADVDGEYFCYHCCDQDCQWIAVCNPMIPESTLLLPPNPWDIWAATFTRLLVDREARTFKVVVMTEDHVTVIFDSVSVEWTKFASFPGLPGLPTRTLVWKGGIYVHDAYECLHTLDVMSGTWTEVISSTEFPTENLKKFCMVSSKDQVMLVQMNLDNDEFICIWKMLNDAPGNVKPFSESSWIKQNIALPKAVKVLAVDFRDCTSHGGDYICFNGGWSYHWIKYDFSKRKWTVFPWRGEASSEVVPGLHWFDWEPSLEGNLKSDHHWEY